ncbi:hypothetical protein LMG26858_04396 [Achromobacter anxifer]|uniref:Uncharacterized protein n=1 Tax=Achromobacter anxifer TaxID=1287737 RepID=A0A6S7EAY9_9BURK|nr:hypothetical protein LMG26858_04396 [Achromobacter anxifer]
MWRCRNCGLGIMFSVVDPEIDEAGCFFMCPGCDYRNKLINVGPYGDDDPISVAQADD